MLRSLSSIHLTLRVALAVLFVYSGATLCQSASFHGLGDLAGGDTFSEAYGVSADGNVVVGSSFSAGGQEAVRWTLGGGLQGLGHLTGGTYFSKATAISANGEVIVGQSQSPTLGTTGFRWTAADGMQVLVDRTDHVLPLAVSQDGSTIVGQRSSGGNLQGFRWNASDGFSLIGYLPDPYATEFSFKDSTAFGVSYDGNIVVGRGNLNVEGYTAYRWTAAGGTQSLGDLPGGGWGSGALAISGDSSTIIGSSHSVNGNEVTRWTSAGMVGLGDLPGGTFFSESFAISADGSTVVGYGTNAAGKDASIWTAATGVRSIRELLTAAGADLTGWQLYEARGVSADGTIVVGRGINPSGQQEGWVANLSSVPEPTSAALVGLAVLMFVGRYRRPCVR